MDVLEDKNVKIRKPQKCFGCAREFPKGTTLRYTKSVDQGEFASGYWCKTCLEYWDKYMEDGDQINFGDLKHQDKEVWEEVKKRVEGV